MCGGAVLPGHMVVTQIPQPQHSTAVTSPEAVRAHPIVWWAHYTVGITSHLVSLGNLEGHVTNSYLELPGSVIHHACMDDCFNIYKRATLSCTDNMAVIW